MAQISGLLCSLLHPTTKHLNRSIGDVLVFPCTGVDTMADGWQLTQGGAKVRRTCQSTIMGGACTEIHHSDRTLRTAWLEKGDFKIGIKKHWVDFICIYVFSRRPKQTVHLVFTFFYQYVCSLGIEPTTFALLTQCSTTEPQEHNPVFLLSL